MPKSGAVFLIDAMGYIFRAYHAMARVRSMSTRTGVPTAATYVFVNMLRKLREDFHPEYMAAAFDLEGPTFRDEQAAEMRPLRKYDAKTGGYVEVEYAGYKAGRAATPEDLLQQLPYIRRALEAFRVPILEYRSYEADDVIATLARQAAERGHEVYVVSSDKDMLQLVNEQVRMLNPARDNLIYDPAKVEEVLGVPPEKVVDVMALRGDTIDNIPGAPGIGDKGSVELIRRFGTVEATLDRVAEVEKKSYRESLQHNREVVLQSKKMVTLDRNVPVALDLAAMRAQEPDGEACRKLFSELEFTSLLNELAPSTDLGEREYAEAKGAEDVAKHLKLLAKGGVLAVAAVRSEPAAKRKRKDDEEEEENEQTLPLTAIAEPEAQARFAISAATGKALECAPESAAFAAFAKTLADAKVLKSSGNSKQLMHELEAHGVEAAGVRDDTGLYSYLLNPTLSSHALESVAMRRLNVKAAGGAAEAADLTGRLAASLREEVEKAGLLKVYNEIDLPLVAVLARMERAGVKIHSGVLAAMSSRLEEAATAKAAEIYQLAGAEFNINSPRQLGDVLFNRLKLPLPAKRGKGKAISTAIDVMEELAQHHEVPRMVLEYRQLTKLKSTYVDALPAMIDPRTGRLHTTFHQTGTATGRLASYDPNLQNIPVRTELGREIRAAFIAEPGNLLLAADYSQIELRLLAHFSGDEMLVEAFRRGEDIHTLTASQVFGVPPMMMDAEHRRRAKAVNFGIVYGLSPFGLAQQLGIEQSEAKKFIGAYFEKYKAVRGFIDRTIEEARREQKVRNLFGRVRPIPDINSRNPAMRGFAERTAVNTPLQGTAADLIKIAMIHIDAEIPRRRLRARMTLQVHDELVFEAPEKEIETLRELVLEKMQNACALSVPLVVDAGVGKTWRDLKN